VAVALCVSRALTTDHPLRGRVVLEAQAMVEHLCLMQKPRAASIVQAFEAALSNTFERPLMTAAE